MRLQTYLEVEKISIAGFARACGVGRRTMHRIVLGVCLPRRALMMRIYELTHGAVTPNDFYELPELAQEAA